MSMFNRYLLQLKNVFYGQKRSLNELPTLQHSNIVKSIWFLNIVIMVIIVALNFKVHAMVSAQNKSFKNQITVTPAQKDILASFKHKYTKEVSAKVFLTDDRLIDIKSQTVSIPFVLTMKYPESWFKDISYPAINVDNGVIDMQNLQYREVNHGMVEVMVSYRATLNTTYSSLMYPLDKQMIWLNLNMYHNNESDTNYPYISINEFHRNPPVLKSRNYHLIKDGFINRVAISSIPIGNTIKSFHDLNNMSYLIYSHKNIPSYLKTTQYIILALFIALFALLINQKNGSAMSGRISVIGSSVFSLSANVFQINSLMHQSSGVILIDVMSAFVGIIILTCFLITVHTIKIHDKFGFEASKIYDVLAFRSVLFHIIIFFTLVYIQA